MSEKAVIQFLQSEIARKCEWLKGTEGLVARMAASDHDEMRRVRML